MALSDLLINIAESYENYKAEGTVDSSHQAYSLVTRQFPDALKEIITNERPYKLTGSTGQGNVTPAPWIAIFDKAITDTAQRGYYVVYLYSCDLLRVYLSLALGVTEFESTYGSNRKMLGYLDAASNRLASKIDIPEGCILGPIDLEAENPTSLHGKYEHSNIVGIEYDLTDLPPDDVLNSDLIKVLGLYEQLRQEVGPNIDEEEAIADLQPLTGQSLTVKPFIPKQPKGSAQKGPSSKRPPRRSKAAKKIGDAGEKLVVEHEKKRLRDAGREDLVSQVRWLADKGIHPGYDILSFNEDETERWIEVKTTKGSSISAVELTENERQTAVDAPPGRYHLYLVTKVFKSPELMIVEDPVRQLTWDENNPMPASWQLNLF